jgi:arylsulfatase A-like enzyme
MTPAPDVPALAPLAPLAAGGRARLAGGLVAGWVLHDLLVFAVSGEPSLAALLVLHSLALTALGALVGLLALRSGRSVAATLALVALLWLGRDFVPVHWTAQRLALIPALATLTAAAAAGRWLVLHARLGSGRTGLALGALGCPLLALTATTLTVHSVTFALGATLALATGRVRAPGTRRALTSAAALLALGPATARAWQDAAVPRPDLPQGLPAGATAADAPQLNLLLVVLDTVRADRLAPYGYVRTTTPHLDAVVRERALRHTNARSTSSWTLPSHASLFTGLLPSEHGATHPRSLSEDGTVRDSALPAQRLRADVPTLAEILRERGFRTGAVIANTAYLTPRYGLDRGFEHYDSRPGGLVGDYFPLAQMAWLGVRAGRQIYRNARSVTDRALGWLARDPGQRPFFLTVNYMDAHAPYIPAAPFAAAFGGEVVAEPWILKRRHRSILYDRSLLSLDAELARLLEAVDYERTVVIVTSDHGEALGDHGFWMHDWTLYEDVVHVPLYVMRPGAQAGTDAEPISGADVFRLALDTLGVAAPEREPEAEHGRAVFGEWYRVAHKPTAAVLADKDVDRNLLAWMEGPRKLIVSSTGAVEAYDLTRDPREVEPLTLSESELADAREKADNWWRTHPALDTGEVDGLDPDDLERMRKLGYMDGDS